MKYFYPLTSPFTPGETFFMRGKTWASDFRFTVSFYNRIAQKWPLYIRVFNEQKTRDVTDIAIWEDGVAPINEQKMATYYGFNEEFEIRVNSSATQAFITLKNKVVTYNLSKKLPLTDTTDFVINFSAWDEEKVILNYIGWTGNCWFEPFSS
uniref:Galectin n=1 Tax=Caenorhabditis tropicalis TaxID=1561998 RepID=A0A1I7UYF1_9PELO